MLTIRSDGRGVNPAGRSRGSTAFVPWEYLQVALRGEGGRERPLGGADLEPRSGGRREWFQTD